MPQTIKNILGIVFVFIILIAAGGVIFYNMLKSSLPEYEGEAQLNGLNNEVEIYFDSTAIPYIFASNEEDAAFAFGYLHARERLFSMDLIRRAGEGKLSEIFGTATIPFDKMFRTVGIKSTAEKIFQRANLITKKLLTSYSKGVNAYIEEAGGNLPVEFDVLGYLPEKWTPVESIIVIRMMAWQLNISWWSDFTFIELVQKLGAEKVKEIYPDYPENGELIIPSSIQDYPKIVSDVVDVDKCFRKFLGFDGTHIGSNNWVVNGNKSGSGKPIIANDPHLAYRAPGIWYAAVLNAGGWKAAGVSLPGVPGFVIGKNENISWVLTNIMLDDADFYIEKFDSSKKKYLLDGEWKNLIVHKDTIHVKDSADVLFEIISTHRGPIISDIHPLDFLYTDKQKTSVPISMRWLGNEISDEFSAIYKVNHANNFNEFKKAVYEFSVPGQNFVYGDKEGNIGYVFGGQLPMRTSNSPTMIFDGTTSEFDWKGFVPREQMPSLFNPPQNFIASANNKTVKDFPYHISNIWEPSSRIDRIYELMNSKEKHSAQDFMKYQMDFTSPYAHQITNYILEAFQNIKVTDKNLSTSLALFAKWNYELDQYSQLPSIYVMFLKKFLENTFRDEMGSDLYNEFIFVGNIPYRSILQVLENDNCSWYDDKTTRAVETKEMIIRKSFADALSELEKKYGREIKNWQWGEMHKLKFKHSFSGAVSFIDNFVNIGPFSVGGDGTTIFNTEYTFSESIEKYPVFKHDEFENDLGPSMRFIYDFSKPDEFYLVLTTGQSGNIFSDYYSSMTNYWLEGKYFKIRTDELSAKSEKNKLLRLLPN